MLKRVFIWRLPVRLTHWVNVAAITVLSITGYYIGNPFVLAPGFSERSAYVMATVRFVHIVAAFVFIGSLALRTYWAFAGDQYARWHVLFPFLFKEKHRGMVETFRYYTFRRRHPPPAVGHNPLAGLTYAWIVFLYFVQVLTGFALLAYANPTGLWWTLSGWAIGLFGIQTLRLVHHLVMWLLIAFVIHHVYSALLVDLEEGNGTISSIFSGFKFIPSELSRDQESPAAGAGEHSVAGRGVGSPGD